MTSTDRLERSLRSYLSQHGWLEQPPGLAGSLWRMPNSDPVRAIAVPFGEIVPGEREWRGVIERLAEFERRSVEEVSTSVVNQFVDVTYLRAANDFAISGSIPLAAGASLVTSAKEMFRSSATTAQRARAYIGGNFSKIGDGLVESARLGHTMEGSYILPVLMPLTNSAPDDPDVPPITGLDLERVELEPPERRIVRTFAEALTAVDKIIIEPARDPTSRVTADLVVAGVSREFVVALRRIVAEPTVAEFEAKFEWAPGVKSPSGIPQSVDIPNGSSELLERTARLLKQTRRDAAQVVTGPIVEVRRMPDDPYGEIAIQTTRGGRSTEVRVRLDLGAIDRCFEWMRSGKTVIAEGDITRGPGRRLRIVQQRRFTSLEATFLGGSE